MENYIEITPQDLSSVLSLLDYLIGYAKEENDKDLLDELEELKQQHKDIFGIRDSDKIKLPYNRKDYYNILEYLKLQAEQLSEGRWNDFSDSDIGTVFLKLMSYLGDMQNFQVDKSIAELYLSTCTERASALLLCRLIGYEPRHFMSAEVDLYLGEIKSDSSDKGVPNGTVVPRGSIFTTDDGTKSFVSLEPATYTDGAAKVKAYEGKLKTLQFKLENISELGRIVLPDYNIAFNTVQLVIDSESYKRVENVTINTGELAFSVHCSEDRYIYLQLPAFWSDVITSASYIDISYCISSGEDGRVGKNKITEISSLDSVEKGKMIISKSTASVEGYNPETISEIKIHAPIRARTMDTIVTIKDFEEVGSLIDGIADIKALDYNDPSSGLIQPTPGPGGYVNDAYKVNIYVLPDTVPYDTENTENNKYRNTIIKARKDWEWEDMGNVADDVEHYSKDSISGGMITLVDAKTLYNIDDVILGVDTLHENTSFLPKYIEYTGTDTINKLAAGTEDFKYTIRETGNNLSIIMCSNWKTFLTGELDKLSVFFKSEQVLTKSGQSLREYIDARRLHSLLITYYDVDILNPHIKVNIYMDSRNTEFEFIASRVKDFILEKYSRKNLKLGDPIFESVIGADILDEFPDIKYLEVQIYNIIEEYIPMPKSGHYEETEEIVDKVEPLPREFIDIIPPNITTTAYDYRNRTI